MARLFPSVTEARQTDLPSPIVLSRRAKETRRLQLPSKALQYTRQCLLYLIKLDVSMYPCLVAWRRASASSSPRRSSVIFWAVSFWLSLRRGDRRTTVYLETFILPLSLATRSQLSENDSRRTVRRCSIQRPRESHKAFWDAAVLQNSISSTPNQPEEPPTFCRRSTFSFALGPPRRQEHRPPRLLDFDHVLPRLHLRPRALAIRISYRSTC